MNWLNWFKSEKSINTARPVSSSGSTFKSLINEPYTGAWEKNDELQLTNSLTSYAVFACISLISKDIGKLPLVAKTEENGIKTNIKFKGLDVINKPNNYQTRQQFFEAWINSKASNGNAYIYKIRDVYGDIEQLVVLNPDDTTVLVDNEGNVLYRIYPNPLIRSGEQTIVPASEIIHDRHNNLEHPLIGLSPIIACNLAASTGYSIQKNANKFFANGSRPEGILSTPEDISAEDAETMKSGWNKKYSNGGEGGVALVSGGITYQTLSVPAADAQMIEHLKLSSEMVCTAFNVPAFKIGIGAAPSGSVEYLNSKYFSDCLQHYVEAIENLLQINLDLPTNVVLEFDLRSLFRMDSNAQMSYLKEGVGSGIFSPNEARAVLGYQAVEGGESPLMQQQNFSLSALSRRDNQADPFSPDSIASSISSESANAVTPSEAPSEAVEPSATDGSEDNQKSVESKLQAIYKGVFNTNTEYSEGDFITKSGSLWHCDNKHCGEFDYSNFTLAVKKGEASNVTNA